MNIQTNLFDRPSFHNTVEIKGQDLDKAETRARSLEDKVLQLFHTSHRVTGIAKCDLIEWFGSQYSNISYGRALSNLVDRTKERSINRIVKSDKMVQGKDGMPNHIYIML